MVQGLTSPLQTQQLQDLTDLKNKMKQIQTSRRIKGRLTKTSS